MLQAAIVPEAQFFVMIRLSRTTYTALARYGFWTRPQHAGACHSKGELVHTFTNQRSPTVMHKYHSKMQLNFYLQKHILAFYHVV